MRDSPALSLSLSRVQTTASQIQILSDESPVQSRRCSVPLKTSRVLPQKHRGHVLVYYKRDTAGRSDPDDVGKDAFVETSGSFVPEREKGEI